MASKAGEKTASDDKDKDKKAADDGAAGDDAGKKSSDDGGNDDDAGEGKQDPPKKKAEKTFTKAEIDAAAKKAVEDAKKKWEDEKDLTELERLKKENADLQASNRLRDARDEVVESLGKAGAKSPALIFNSIKDQLKFDDAGKLINSKDLIESVKGDFPEQFGDEKPEGGIGGGAGQGGKGSGEKLTKEKLSVMTPAEVNELPWEDVSRVMAEK